MKLYILGICIFLALFTCLEAKHGRKDKWRSKKHQSKLAKFDGSWKDGGVDNLNNVNDKSSILKPPVPGDKLNQHRFGPKRKYKHYKKKHANKKHHKNMSWLKLKTADECNMKCKLGEVCISSPIDKRPLCVDKRDLKKSVKLFHRYHKKETKSWRKFQKKNYKKDRKWLKKQDKIERKKNAEIIALKEKYMKKKYGDKDIMKKPLLEKDEKKEYFERMTEKNNFKDSMDKLDFKDPIKDDNFKDIIKKDDFKDSKKEHDSKHSVTKEDFEQNNDKYLKMTENRPALSGTPYKPVEEGECTSSEFVQMRTRMMGWFHLLHGQDHLARKAHGGGIGKFYKHISVKKELREFDGVKCGCLKSAMWEFHQLDKTADDHLTPDEMAILEQNSLEPCMKPYLKSCDRNDDEKLSSDEWCCCFSHILAPCFKKIDEIKKSGDKDALVPRCDKEGYFMREQCRSDVDDQLFCWCVDINGSELKGTATDGRAHCSKLARDELKNTPFF